MRSNFESSKQSASTTRFRKRSVPDLVDLSIITSLLILFLIPIAFGQSGRQTPPPPKPQPPPQAQGRRPVTTKADETRPRRVDEVAQDEKPLKLKADLVTVITSVTDAAGNQVNDLTQRDFDVYEDNSPQDIAGFYRE